MRRTDSGSPDDPKGPSVEVALHTEHDGLPLFNPLLLIGPLARELYRCLYSFGPGVHWKDHVISEEEGDLLGKGPET